MSARVQSSYMSTKPSKLGAVAESVNFSLSNNNNNIIPGNFKSWLHGFDTQRGFYQTKNALRDNSGSADKNGHAIGTAVGGSRVKKNKLLSMEQRDQINIQMNPKTAIGGNRAFMNRSIGSINPVNEAQTNLKGLKLNQSSNMSGFDSRILPSVQGSQEKDKLLYAKNRQIVNESIQKLKSSTNKRRAISLLNGSQQNQMKDGQEQPNERPKIVESPNSWLKEQQKKNLDSLAMIEKFPKMSIDHRIVEQWLNDTLSDAEHFKLPGVISKIDHQNPISRYGIDRMTLTNAGIPNEDVNHLYRAMFVYSVGFFSLIRDTVDKSKEVYLQFNDGARHVTKFSIEDFKVEREERENEINEMLKEYRLSENQMETQIQILKEKLDQAEVERAKEQQTRVRMEEELLKNQKTHEEEVNLRLKFEEKLNNLHALNRITNQNLLNTQNEFSHVNKIYTELQIHCKQITVELAQEKIKAGSFEQKYIYSQDKNNLLTVELADKQKHAEKMLTELSGFIDKYELYNYKFQSSEKELANEKLRVDRLEVENKHLNNNYEHFKNCFEESQQKNRLLTQKINELNTEFQKSFNELTVYRQEHTGYQTHTNQKGEIIEELKNLIKEGELKFKHLEELYSELKARYNIADHELQILRVDYELATSKVEQINKARNDAENKLREKTQKLRLAEQKMHDRDEQIMRNHRKIHELDEKLVELEKQYNQLEKEKSNNRVEFEQIKRQQLDKIHSLEELIKNEKELRQNWCERYDKESKALSQQNLDVIDMKTRVSETESRVRHLKVELDNEKKLSESLINSKKELMETLNHYIVNCEMQEKDLFAMKEVSKHFEQIKEKEHKELKQEIIGLKLIILNRDMNVEEYYTKLGYHFETIMKQKSMILRQHVEIGMLKRFVDEFRDTLKERNEDISIFKAKVKKLEDEASTAKNNYKIMKAKIEQKEDELYQQTKEMRDLQEKMQRVKQKKRDWKTVSEQHKAEITAMRIAKALLQNKDVQTLPLQNVDQDIQCNIMYSANASLANINSSGISNMQPFKQQPINFQEKYENEKKEKEKKKKDRRDQILRTSKLQNELNSRYDITKIMGKRDNRNFSKNSGSNSKERKTPQEGQMSHPMSTQNVVKYIEDLGKTRKFSEENVMKSDQNINSLTSDLNLISQIDNRHGSNNSSSNQTPITPTDHRQLRERGRSVMSKHRKQKLNENGNNISLIVEGQEQEDSEDLDHYELKDAVLKEIEMSQRMMKNMVQQDQLLQDQIDKIQQSNVTSSQNSPNKQRQKMEQKEKKQIKSFLRNAFHDR
ncbi:UNKNOWN [Stylonychia lemnae]|uniref:Uncharacterized protein n=1 Tax=Stylonychia lemnae TaxID=5949 RepID=A0A078AVZ9_STYLE|nr:UNKNOWN [Stylonychia lemnae]|eukprot:CDW85387.1 UNKNOWN [Stylonychia lemnae]